MVIRNGEKMVAGHVQPADSFWKRFLGLMGKKQLKEGEGLLLFSCSSIHCFFMRFPIDAVYLSKDKRVLGIETVKPWRIGRLYRGAKHVLELPGGFAAGKITVGDRLEFKNI